MIQEIRKAYEGYSGLVIGPRGEGVKGCRFGKMKNTLD
jgi:hypothetical protein